MKLTVFVLSVLFLLLQYQLWFADGNVFDTLRLKDNVAQQKLKHAEISKRNLELSKKIKALKTDTDVVEQKARTELGMVKEGETYYQIVSPAD